MKHSKYFSLTLTFFLAMLTTTIAQTCDCDSLIKSRKVNWTRWVENSDSIKILKVVKIGIIKSEKERHKVLKQLTSDTAWSTFPVSGKTVMVQLGRLDTLFGRQFSLPINLKKFDTTSGKPVPFPGETIPMRKVGFASKKASLEHLNKYIALQDEHFEFYFSMGNTIFMTPVICSKTYCTTVDNIFFNLFIKS